MGDKNKQAAPLTPTPEQLPASARPIADDNGRTVTLLYSPAHIERLKQMKREGKRIKLPPGVSLDDDAPSAQGSTDSTAASNLPLTSNTATGTAGSSGRDA